MKNKQLQKNIPIGWQQVKLGDVLNVGSGKDYKHLDTGDVPVFGTGGYMLSVNKPLHSGETVFIGRKGTIDKPFYFKGDFWTVDTLFYTHKFKNTTAKYINHVFRKIDWKSHNEASGVPSLSKTTIEKIKIPLPPLPEQNRIVSVLETWDQLIEKLSKKIEVKKQIKKSLMQNLLTGKKRLAGFNNKWKIVSLGEILKERNERDVESDSLLLYSLTIENGVCPKGERYDRSFLVKSDSKVYKKTYKNDIVYNPANLRYGAIAHNKNENPVLLSPIYQTLHVKNDKETNIDFIGQLLTWERQIRKMSAYAEGTLIERMEVKIDSFKTIQIDIPEKKEQDAIANIINVANKEITELEKKLQIIEDQKKYLLNNLITGTIRTPETLSAKLIK